MEQNRAWLGGGRLPTESAASGRQFQSNESLFRQPDGTDPKLEDTHRGQLRARRLQRSATVRER